MSSTLPSKVCVSCGRSFNWRKKWERDWESVRYCSNACRRNGLRPLDGDIERTLLELLGDRDGQASICPSEVARRIAPEDWRELMEPVRRAARRLSVAGRVEITQKGRPVDPDRARGPIRIRRRDDRR